MNRTMTILAAFTVLVAMSGHAAAEMRYPSQGASEIMLANDFGFNAAWGRRQSDDGNYGNRDRRGRWEQRSDDGEVLPVRRIVRVVLREGFASVDDIELRRDRYVVRAVRPNGAVVRLAVDAYDGEIIARERIGWSPDGRGFDRDRFHSGRQVFIDN